jgi:hypothetical protein
MHGREKTFLRGNALIGTISFFTAIRAVSMRSGIESADRKIWHGLFRPVSTHPSGYAMESGFFGFAEKPA